MHFFSAQEYFDQIFSSGTLIGKIPLDEARSLINNHSLGSEYEFWKVNGRLIIVDKVEFFLEDIHDKNKDERGYCYRIFPIN